MANDSRFNAVSQQLRSIANDLMNDDNRRFGSDVDLDSETSTLVTAAEVLEKLDRESANAE